LLVQLQAESFKYS